MKTIRIEVLGPGCKNCDDLYNNVRKAVEKTGTPDMVKLEKKQDINYFIKMGVFSTPALVIQGKVVSSSRVLNPDQIIDLFRKYGIC
jgi:small redox-active disulfide protein 2